jgi:poly(hydroxyalkanoate) depolymerase family esterase
MPALFRKLLRPLVAPRGLLDATRTMQRVLSSLVEAGAHTAGNRPAPMSPPAGAAPATPTGHADVGVGQDSTARRTGAGGAGSFVAGRYTGRGGTRGYKLFVPSGFGDALLPLVVMLHGCTQDPDDFAAGTRMNALAEEEGFLVLYPAQAERSNAHKCWNWFSPRDQRRGAGEPALLAGMTRHIVETHRVDADRVYVAGLSAGGAMAAILAREYPDVFAAAGVHSGVTPGAAHDVASAFAVMKSGPQAADASAATVPMIVFHGGADRTVVAANGDAVARAALGGTPAVATTSDGASAGRAFRRTVWHAANDADGPALVEQWLVQGAPHAWSGGSAGGSYADPAGPDASREMLRFFREHRRRSV